MSRTGIESNLWKYFLIIFTNRRNYIPILSVYFLTLPNVEASQIGLYMGISYLATLIMQMPSGIIADRYWQRFTLILAKTLLALSTFFYIIADGFWGFCLAGICSALALNAFSSGTTSSFLKGTLEKLWKGDDYRHTASRMAWNASLLSVIFIVLLPFLTNIDIRAPLYAALVIDIFWLVVATTLVPVHTKIEKHESKSIFVLAKELRGTSFFPYAFYVATISAFLFADNAFRSPYLIQLGYPLAYIGLVMALSRVIWWIVSRHIHTIEKYISFQKLIRIELVLFPLYYMTTGYISNPWIVGCLFGLVIWWFWWRSEVYTDQLFDRIADKKYRNTTLSMKSQIQNIMEMIISFGIAGVMGASYALWFQTLGIILFVLLFVIYFFWIRGKSL